MTVRILTGNALDVLRTLETGSVQTCVTSPPYYGLRSYGVEPSVWGGDADCEHELGGLLPSAMKPYANQVPQTKWKNVQAVADGQNAKAGAFCQKCGAWLGSLGLEPTPDLYVEHLVAIFREVKRVLRDDGTLWVNLGDSYNAGTSASRQESRCGAIGRWQRETAVGSNGRIKVDGLKPKDLIGIPWMVAFALRADGWYLRSDIIWDKPNAMPESVEDRPTRAHEYVFLLSKSARYYYDAEAIRESNTPDMIRRAEMGHTRGGNGKLDASRNDHDTLRGEQAKAIEASGRNARSVWHINTAPYADAHFATFPPELPERCIKAGTSERGCCPECGKAWKRIIEHIAGDTEAQQQPKRTAGMDSPTSTLSLSGNGSLEWARRGSKISTVGWAPSCKCGTVAKDLPIIDGIVPYEWPDPIPCTVLDPFAGAGTTGLVADRLGRDAILIELNPTYAEMARQRIANDAPMFAEVEAAPPEPTQAALFEVAP